MDIVVSLLILVALSTAGGEHGVEATVGIK